MPLTYEDLLNEPPKFKFGCFPTKTQNSVELKITPPSTQIEETILKINNIPATISIVYNETLVTQDSLIEIGLETRSLIISSLKNITEFSMELDLTTIRFNNLTNESMTVRTTLFYPISFDAFTVEYEFKIEYSCYDVMAANKILLEIPQLLNSDKLALSVIRKPSFVFLNFTRVSREIFNIYLNSTEIFDEIELEIEFKVNNDSNAGSKELFVFKLCSEISQTNQPGGLSTGAIVGIVFGCIGAFIIVLIVIIKINRNMKKI